MWPYGPSPFGPITSPCKASNGISCEIHKLVDLNIFKVLRGESCGMLAEYADWGTPASLLHRMNGAAVFAASVCSNSTVPTWVMAPEATCEWTTTSFTAAKLRSQCVWTLENSVQLYTNVIECGICITVHVCFHMLSLYFGVTSWLTDLTKTLTWQICQGLSSHALDSKCYTERFNDLTWRRRVQLLVIERSRGWRDSSSSPSGKSYRPHVHQLTHGPPSNL